VSLQRIKTLDYLPARQAVPTDQNPAAAISVALGLAAILFVASLCVGTWSRIPEIHRNAGWICGAMAITAMISGAIGAFRAPLESRWYHIAWLGYAQGIFVLTFTPLLFL
jgi:hypothetical protein